MTSITKSIFLVGLFFPLLFQISAQSSSTISGIVRTADLKRVPGAAVEVVTASGSLTSLTDSNGEFRIDIGGGAPILAVTVSGENLTSVTKDLSAVTATTNLDIRVDYTLSPLTASVTIQDEALTPDIELRNGSLYSDTLFSRDDQLIQTLNAGINAGQHEGGGKSLEIRRYGFNLDHGGVNGGLKILVDNVQQNQSTQGHGQGYLGSLKSLSPELVESISIINGPFSAAYGDYSGLGVVHIIQRQELPHWFTARMQAGSFNTFRGFFAISPEWKNVSSVFSYEPSYTDGPFKSPLRYRRHNINGNITYKSNERQAISLRFNAGTNDFFSSGQLPLDLVNQGELDRFGFIDPENGGKGQAATVSGYYRREFASGAILRADAFVNRSLYDLYSNFTFFLTDTVFGDEIQQHDSRLQQGGNLQYIRALNFFGNPSVVTAGFGIHASQINVGLYPTVSRAPNRKIFADNLDNPDILFTSADAKIINYGAYVQNETRFFDGRLRVGAGVRIDHFDYFLDGFELRDSRQDIFASEGKSAVQPKFSAAWTPIHDVPLSLYVNYGRGILSQDARGIARQPDGPKLAVTDFYQAGGSFDLRRASMVLSSFFIDRSNEQVYIPDDGTVELAGRSRSYGIETRATVKITDFLSFNGGLTRVIAAFYPGEFTPDGSRVIVDSAPRLVANGGFVLSGWKGFTGALSWRHISSYRLDGEDPAITASGHDVVDLAVARRINKRVTLNFSVDNLLDKRYYETQNFFESRTCPSCETLERIHATPGYPITFNVGITWTMGAKR